MDDRFFEKHEITVEILHDPTLEGKAIRPAPPAAPSAPKPPAPPTPPGPPAPPKQPKAPAPQKKKSDFVAELAALMEVPVTEIDPTLTVKAIQDMIKEMHAEQAAAGTGGAPGQE